MKIRAYSNGGGVQSIAALVLAAQKKIDFPLFLFANVGEDSENPETLEYMQKYAVPFGEKHGIEMMELRKTDKDGNAETLYSRITRRPMRYIEIPVKIYPTGTPLSRVCTHDFKIAVISRELRKRGARKKNPADLGIGFSMDEVQRIQPDDPRHRSIHKVHPLIDLRLTRKDCARIIADAGLPVPPKSSCYFCPFHTTESWIKQKVEHPELFQKVVEIENYFNEERVKKGLSKVFFSRKVAPLEEVVNLSSMQPAMEETDDACGVWHCMT